VDVANPCSGAVVAFEFPCIFDDFVSVKAESTVAAVALALGAVTTEIADRVETIKTKAKKWWSAGRTTRLKVAILAAKSISTSTLLI
jgi:hypothetical protein